MSETKRTYRVEGLSTAGERLAIVVDAASPKAAQAAFMAAYERGDAGVHAPAASITKVSIVR